MLGLGSRFMKVGIKTPKYLLNLAEEKVLYYVLYGFRNLNKSRFIFLVRKDHDPYNTKYEIEKICRYLDIDDFNIIKVKKSTKGQADSVRLALPYCSINKPLLIFNIDTIHLGLNPDFNFKADGMLETFLADGNHWSFAKVGKNNLVEIVTEKNRISNNCSNGLYFFRNINDFQKSYLNLYENKNAKNIYTFKENYIAPMYNIMIKNGMRILNRNVSSNLILTSGIPEEYFFLNQKYKKKSELESKFINFY